MKSYKILRVISIYNEIFSNFLEKRDVSFETYEELLEKFKAEHYLYINSFEENMIKHKNLSNLIIYNFENLQDKWLQENSTKFTKNFNREEKLFEIFRLQLAKMKPDVLFFQHSTPFDLLRLKNLKEDFPFIKKIIFHNGIPIKDSNLKYVDHIFSAVPYLASFYKSQSINSSLLYHYFDKEILQKLSKSESYNDDLIFIGKTGDFSDKNHLSRFEFLNKILNNDNINFKCFSLEKKRQELIENKFSQKKILRDKILNLLKKIKPSYLKYLKFKNLPLKLDNLLNDAIKNEKKIRFLHQIHKNRILAPIYGIEMYEQLKNSRVVFNMHTDEANNESGNIRMFEVTGVGSCLITNDSANIKDLFIPDQEILTYKSYDEFLSKYKEIINNENLQKILRINGQNKTIKHHTTEKRVEEMNHLINQILN